MNLAAVPGQRYTQVQPINAFSIGGQGPGQSPVTLFSVPAGRTYRLWGVHLSLAIGTASGFIAVSGAGVNAFIQDSGGNVYIDVEAFCFTASQQSENANAVDCRGAVLPGGTAVTMVMGAVPANVGARMGGGAIWSPT